MKKLTQMRDAGLINAVEFESKKKEILADLVHLARAAASLG